MELNNCMQRKLNFVNEISGAIVKVQGNVEKISYEVFTSPAGYVIEWVTVTYVGGAMTNINVTGTSESAILEEIASYLCCGNYSNNEYYLDCVNTWTKLC